MDPNPTVTYPVHPPTSTIGTFTITCKATLLSFLERNPSSALIPDLQITAKIKNQEEIYLNKTTGISLNPGEIKLLQIRVPEGEIKKVIVSSPCGVSTEYEPLSKIEC